MAGSARSTTSARQAPPKPTATARSVTIFPGSWTGRAARHLPSPPDSPACSPVIRAVSVSSAPAWDTIPDPSPDTVIFGRRTVFCI